MSKIITALLLLAIFSGLILLAVNSWRRRRREQALSFNSPAETLDGAPTGDESAETAKVQYVATTIAGEPLNRVTAYGLGFRGRAIVWASGAGFLIERNGERSLAIASSQLVSVDFTQAVIGRAVEKDGLVAINWRQDATELTTVLRFNSAGDRDRILQAGPVLARKATQ
jgi:hypothetical protein